MTAVEKELRRIERTLHEQYERAKKELVAKWDAMLKESLTKLESLRADLASATTEEAKKAAQNAIDEYTKHTVAQDAHFRNMVNQMNERITHELEIATDYVNGRLPHVYTISYNAAGADIARTVRGYSFELCDESTLKAMAKNPTAPMLPMTDQYGNTAKTQKEVAEARIARAKKKKDILPYKTVNREKTKRWNMKHINAEVTQGILQGESIDEIAARLTHVIGDAEAAAVRTARTTVTSAENKGRMDQYHAAEEAGIVMMKRWNAFVGDPRTRDWHADLDGEEVGIDEDFENEYGRISYPGDPAADPANVYNCRCTLTSVIKGFKNKETGSVVPAGLSTYEEVVRDPKPAPLTITTIKRGGILGKR